MKFGNSILAINARFWTCSYCGHLIKDKKPFDIVRVDFVSMPLILCSPYCLRIQIKRMEKERVDK